MWFVSLSSLNLNKNTPNLNRFLVWEIQQIYCKSVDFPVLKLPITYINRCPLAIASITCATYAHLPTFS